MSQYQDYQSYPPAYPSAPQNNTMAIVSLIAGIASWVIFPLIGAIIAVITGHMAKSQIRNSMGRETGDGLATAGLILGYAQLALGLCGICAFVGFMVFSASVASVNSYSLLSGILPLL